MVPVPKFDYVTDTAGLLTPEQKQSLWDKLHNFDTETGSQVCVVIVPSTNGESIESFAHRVGDDWRPGRKGVGDGLIVFVAVNDHRARIDVMRALEGAIPDVAANKVLQEDMFPDFKDGNYYEGINKGLDAIFALIKGENLPSPSATDEDEDENFLLDEPWLVLLIMSFGIAMAMRQIFGENSPPFAWVLCSALGWLMMGSLIAGILISFVAVLVSILIPERVLEAGAKRTARMNSRVDRRWNDRDRWGGGGFGGFGGGGFGGGGGMGGGMGGGASSGGGGSAGGGGASGGW